MPHVTIRSSAIRRVGVRFPNWITYHSGVIRGLLSYMRDHEQWLLEVPQDTTGERKEVRIDEHWDGDGLLLFRYSKQEASAFQRRGIKVVNLSAENVDGPFPSVVPDNVHGGREAARHLLASGLREFAYFGRSYEVGGRLQIRRYSEERAAGFADAIAEAGGKCRISHVLMPEVEEGGLIIAAELQKRILALLKNLPRPCGIFAADDLFASVIIEACQKGGADVPGEFAIVGFNNEELFCHTTAPPLSSVTYPGEAIGRRAASVLDRMLHGEDLGSQEWRVRVAGVAERESTNLLAVRAPLVAEAVRIIRERSPEYPLRVNELLESLKVSYSGLNKVFTDALGVTPKQEISRVRLEAFRRLLIETDWTTERIANHMKFESVEDARRFFRRACGMSASDYRKEHRRAWEAR